nr:aromatic-ring-hydroxylating dioxygenase subunit beta [Novosphingobium flavum]
MLIDSDALEEWVASFEETGRYIVLPRENRDLGYAIALIKCEKRAILEDRLTVLRAASKFNPHVDRHILSRPCYMGIEGDIVSVQTNFTIVQSSLDGVSKLFCAGVYEDRIRVSGDGATFVERVAVIDTFSVPNLIATPI